MQIAGQDKEIIDKLRKSGLRATSQRLAVMRTLLNDRTHPSAEELFEKLKEDYPTLSLSTVYKTLQVLSETDQIITIDTGSGKQRFDGQMTPHHHAHCSKCGKIFDIDYDKCPVDEPKDILPGFKVQSTKIYFAGVCKDCS